MTQLGTRTIATVSLLATLLVLSGCKNQDGGSGSVASAMNGGGSSGGSSGGGDSSGGSSNAGPDGSPPKISGSPRGAVKVGDTYSFTPTVVEPDGDTLTFYAGNKPRWATFNAKTGKLSGNPGAGDAGTYTNIQVAVSDGSTAVYLPSFSVNVTQSGSSSATISWTPPTQNTDGSALTNLAAYKIYYGVSEGNYPNQVRISNPGISTYVVDNLTPDTYFFVSTSINSNGVESEFSNVARKTVN
jgi:hypothetical protein